MSEVTHSIKSFHIGNRKHNHSETLLFEHDNEVIVVELSFARLFKADAQYVAIFKQCDN